jgi:hypothetical protein
MLKDKNPLLTIKLKKLNPKLSNIFNSIFESLYALYDVILDDPIENFWYECFNIIISYSQLIAFIFDKTVSLI